MGEFALTLPVGSNSADLIEANTLLWVDKADWLLVRNVHADHQLYTVTGHDLKGLLADRITLYGHEQDTGTYGYDVVQGSTETVLKHYIANNLTAPEDENRRIRGLILAADQGRGLASDTYMSRFQPLHELAEAVCKNGKIGYDITADLSLNKMIFDVVTGVDRSKGQASVNRVVFSRKFKNVLSLERESGITANKNVFYATKSGGTLESDATTVMVSGEEEVPAGINRREMQLNVSCDSVADIETYALKDVNDYAKTDSFVVSPGSFDDYGPVYSLGDKVTIEDEALNVTLDAVIAEAEKSITPEGRTLTLTFGTKKPRILNQLNIKINNKGV